MKGNFEIKISGVKEAKEQYPQISQALSECVKRLEAIRRDLPNHSYGDIKNVLAALEEEQRSNIKGIKSMENALCDIVKCYEDTEKRIADTNIGKHKKQDLKRELLERMDNLLKELIKMLKGMNENCCVYGGDPINLATGNFIYHREYLRLKGLYPMVFQMFYNSVEQTKGILGKGWVHNYQINVRKEDQRAVLLWSDGREEVFIKEEDGQYIHLIGKHDTLEEVPEGMRYQTVLGQSYTFDKEGRVIKAADRNGNALMFFYEGERLKKARSISGETLCYQYNDDGFLSEVSDNKGRRIRLYYEEESNPFKMSTIARVV